MIKIDSRKLSSEDCDRLAGIFMSARKNAPLESKRKLEDVAQYFAETSANDHYRLLIALDEEDSIVGCIYYYAAFHLMDFISGFIPLVDENNNSEKIALSLIEAAKRDTEERGQSRLEIELVFPSEEHRAYSEKYVEWYNKCGFKFAAEEMHMKSDLGAIELPEFDLPHGYQLRNLSEVSYDMLEGPGFRTLEDSKEDLFLSMSHAEQKITLEYFFDKSKPYIDEASLILERKGKIVGFVITRMKDDEPDIGPVGIIPGARGQGLANYLFVRVLKSLKASGSTSAHLDTTITNFPAQKLYRKYGFKEVFYKQFYYWSP